MYLFFCIRMFSNLLMLVFILFYYVKDYDMYDSNFLWFEF